MKIILLCLIALSLFSCCPRIATDISTTVVEKIDTDTVYIDRIVEIQPLPSDTLVFDIVEWCKLLNPEAKAMPAETKVSTATPKRLHPNLVIDSTGIARIFCNEDYYKLKIDSLQILTIHQKKEITNNITKVKYPPWHNMYKYGFWILLLILSIILTLLIKNR